MNKNVKTSCRLWVSLAYTRETNYPLALWSWYRIKFKINGCQYQHNTIWHKTDNMLLHWLYHRQEIAGHERFSSSEMEKIRAALFVMDKFSVSWKACNELTEIDNSLPRSYLVEGCQATVDDQWKITKTRGNNPGAKKQKIMLVKYIWKLFLKMLRNLSYTKVYFLYFYDLQMENWDHPEQEPTFRVKISGDDALMSHSSNLFVLCLSWMMASMYFPVQVC